jgi:hypothetical protein
MFSGTGTILLSAHAALAMQPLHGGVVPGLLQTTLLRTLHSVPGTLLAGGVFSLAKATGVLDRARTVSYEGRLVFGSGSAEMCPLVDGTCGMGAGGLDSIRATFRGSPQLVMRAGTGWTAQRLATTSDAVTVDATTLAMPLGVAIETRSSDVVRASLGLDTFVAYRLAHERRFGDGGVGTPWERMHLRDLGIAAGPSARLSVSAWSAVMLIHASVSPLLGVHRPAVAYDGSSGSKDGPRRWVSVAGVEVALPLRAGVRGGFGFWAGGLARSPLDPPFCALALSLDASLQ